MLSTAIANWWIGFILAAVGAFITWFFKRYLKLEKESQEKHIQDIFKENSSSQEKMLQQIKESQDCLRNDIYKKYEEVLENVDKAMIAGRDESKKDDAELKDEIDKVGHRQDVTQAGLLAIYKPQFLRRCDELLNQKEEISPDDWLDFEKDHKTYNDLGGNHTGDEKFNMIKAKFEKQHDMR